MKSEYNHWYTKLDVKIILLQNMAWTLNFLIMLGFGNLKDKIANLSEGLKSQFSTEIEPTEVESNLKSQSQILSRYQVIIILIIK